MSTQPEAGRIPEWTIAERLSLARTVAGLEKHVLADLIGVSRDTVGNYENRDWPRKRSRAYLRAWALACGVDREWLERGTASADGGPGIGVTRRELASVAHISSAIRTNALRKAS